MKSNITFALAIAVGMLGSGNGIANGLTERGATTAAGRADAPRDVALGHLYTVAMVHAGLVETAFPRDQVTGATSIEYRDNPALDLTESERLAKVEPIVAHLRLLADVDQSGSVSGEEAANLRNLYEFGLRLESTLELGLNSAETVAVACGVPESMLRGTISMYNYLVDRADAVGLSGLSKIAWDGQR